MHQNMIWRIKLQIESYPEIWDCRPFKAGFKDKKKFHDIRKDMIYKNVLFRSTSPL